MNDFESLLPDQHRLLKRQLRIAFPEGKPTKDGVIDFINLVNSSYKNMDEERALNARAEAISNEELRQLNLELSQKNEFLDAFNFGLAHDVKNHSANLRSLIMMLIKYKGNEEKTDLITSKLDLSINQISSILNGFLYLANAEGKMSSEYSVLNSNALRSEIEIEIDHLLENYLGSIEFKIDVDHVYYSNNLLRIVLVNLISNSIKFSKTELKENARIKVNVSCQDSLISLIVEDNGIGMDLNKNGEKILSLFGRTTDVKGTKGFGIGLYMINKILERNKGNINVESAVNVGTTVTILLPLNQD